MVKEGQQWQISQVQKLLANKKKAGQLVFSTDTDAELQVLDQMFQYFEESCTVKESHPIPADLKGYFKRCAAFLLYSNDRKIPLDKKGIARKEIAASANAMAAQMQSEMHGMDQKQQLIHMMIYHSLKRLKIILN